VSEALDNDGINSEAADAVCGKFAAVCIKFPDAGEKFVLKPESG
jgi:hypothetical protein